MPPGVGVPGTMGPVPGVVAPLGGGTPGTVDGEVGTPGAVGFGVVALPGVGVGCGVVLPPPGPPGSGVGVRPLPEPSGDAAPPRPGAGVVSTEELKLLLEPPAVGASAGFCSDAQATRARGAAARRTQMLVLEFMSTVSSPGAVAASR
jgi:hypothetical protein